MTDYHPPMLGLITTSPDEWAGRFVRLAEMVGAWSKDHHRQVGAVLVSGTSNAHISMGYNGFPRGIADLKQRLTGDERLKLMVHAEQNAIDNAHFPVAGSTIYVTKAPCLPCVLRMANARIARVMCPIPDGDKRAELAEALGYASEAGITVSHYI